MDAELTCFCFVVEEPDVAGVKGRAAEGESLEEFDLIWAPCKRLWPNGEEFGSFGSVTGREASRRGFHNSFFSE